MVNNNRYRHIPNLKLEIKSAQKEIENKFEEIEKKKGKKFRIIVEKKWFEDVNIIYSFLRDNQIVNWRNWREFIMDRGNIFSLSKIEKEIDEFLDEKGVTMLIISREFFESETESQENTTVNNPSILIQTIQSEPKPEKPVANSQQQNPSISNEKEPTNKFPTPLILISGATILLLAIIVFKKKKSK